MGEGGQGRGNPLWTIWKKSSYPEAAMCMEWEVRSGGKEPTEPQPFESSQVLRCPQL